jgi:hypothetical protein
MMRLLILVTGSNRSFGWGILIAGGWGGKTGEMGLSKGASEGSQNAVACASSNRRPRMHHRR